MAEKKRLAVPWVAHLALLAAAGGSVAFFAPLLIPVLAKSFAIFAALSTILFPVCRRRWWSFFANYLVSATAAVVIFFRG
jgi:hypothetical protein